MVLPTVTVTERHVSRSTTNIIEIDNHDDRKRPGMPKNSIRFLSKPFHWRGILFLTLAVEVVNVFAMLCRVPFVLMKFFRIPDLLRQTC